MSNSFPSAPSDFTNLASIEYMFNPGSVSITTPSGSTALVGGTISELGSVPNTILVTFSTPGSYGSFDQTSFEETVSGVVTGICQIISASSGASLSTLESGMANAVVRTWTWKDSSGNTATYSDRMTYPAS